MADTRITNEYNRLSASADGYTHISINAKRTDEETRNVISNTFGQFIKNNINALWFSVGLDPNVNYAFQQSMNDPNESQVINGQRFFKHPGVGCMQPYDLEGNSTVGMYTMQAMA